MSAFAQFHSIGPYTVNGQLVTAGKLYHYAAGTNTLKNIWSDRAQTVTLNQPFVADGNGVWNFFADGLYKLVIKDANDLTLYTEDNVLIQDFTSPTFSEGSAIASASTIGVGPETFAHVTGSVPIATITGSIPFVWLVFDGSTHLTNSANLICPAAADLYVNAGDTVFLLNESAGVWRVASFVAGKQGDIAASSTIHPPMNGGFADITGTGTITGITASYAGHTFTARFTDPAGLNLTNSASFLMPWGFDYRVYQNELCRFIAVTPTVWAMEIVTGPKIPVGMTVEDNSTTMLPGFLQEDGSAVSRTTYSGLFGRIGTAFGTGDGSTTFNVPDSRQRVVINMGATNVITTASVGGANCNTMGGTGGEQTHTLIGNELPLHRHQQSGTATDTPMEETQISSGSGFGLQSGNGNGSPVSTFNDGGGGAAHSNTQPWIAKKKYIRY